MADPKLWLGFSVLFVLAGLLNLARSLRGGDERRPVRVWLALSCFLWAAVAALYRFGSTPAAAVAGAAAVGLMLWAAALGTRSTSPP